MKVVMLFPGIVGYRLSLSRALAASGDVELEGTPRVQEGINTHVATSPDTVMIINQKGELNTHGPSRTEIRQPPPGQASPSATPSPTP